MIPKPKRKRPKVRYVADKAYDGKSVVYNRHGKEIDTVTDSWAFAKRVAAALNLYEAVKRGEI